MICSKCKTSNPSSGKYCQECGARLSPAALSGELGERKQVTVFFSDLSGFTAMSENLDPEEVKEIMSRIFGAISEIVSGYGGQVDKLLGDAAMVIFGIPYTHEDDEVRAIKSAMEIHQFVEKLSSEYEGKIETKLAMHTGINTGIVVAGELDIDKGREKVLGDTINVASRLTHVAETGASTHLEETRNLIASLETER